MLVENIKPNTTLINEPRIDQLNIKSKLHIAEQFQDWLGEEVLPSIRKYNEFLIKIGIKMFCTNYIKRKAEIFETKDDHNKIVQKTSEFAINVMEILLLLLGNNYY